MSNLQKGKQWVAHCGARARARYLRQEQKKYSKRSKEAFGVEIDANGRTPSGIIVPGAEPRVQVIER